MRIVRGSSIDGYSGFEKVTKRNNYYILRPLIFILNKIYIVLHRKKVLNIEKIKQIKVIITQEIDIENIFYLN